LEAQLLLELEPMAAAQPGVPEAQSPVEARPETMLPEAR
jgi:hypothetical protein